jgi:hypothetical protein
MPKMPPHSEKFHLYKISPMLSILDLDRPCFNLIQRDDATLQGSHSTVNRSTITFFTPEERSNKDHKPQAPGQVGHQETAELSN